MRTVLAIAVAGAWCAPVEAQVHRFTMDPAELPGSYVARSETALPPACSPRANGNCTAIVGPGRLSVTLTNCNERLQPEGPELGDLASRTVTFDCSDNDDATVQVTWGLSRDPAAIRSVNGAPVIDAPGAQGLPLNLESSRVLALRNSQWERLTTADADFWNTPAAIYSATGASTWFAARIENTSTAASQPDAESSCVATREDCQAQARGENMSEWACYYNERGSNDLTFVQVRSHLIPANGQFYVIVRHPRGRNVRATLTGDTAISEQSRVNQLTSSGCEWSRVSFGPRAAGSALDLSVRLREGGTELDTQPLELHVEQRYWGALRVGVALPFFAVNRSYAVQTVGDSMQTEIVASGSFVDVELIAMFTTFFRPRSYTGDFDMGNVGIFSGAGLLSASATGVQLLTSFFTGLEIEPVRGFAVGAAFVLRRVTRLNSGYGEGDAAAANTTPWGERWEPGVALVFSVSPDFLQFAKGGLQ